MRPSARAQPNDSRAGIESIETGIGLLYSFITLGGRSHKLKLLAETAGMPPAKAHRYLVSFMRMGLVERESVNGHYRLGAKAAELGAVALDALDPLSLSVEMVMELRQELGHTFAVCVWGSSSPVVVRVEEADRLLTVNVRVGKSLPLLNSSAGQLFAAFLPRRTVEPLIEAEVRANMKQGEGRFVRSMVQADRRLAEVRSRGLARNDGYVTPGISSLAAPVFNKQGDLVTTISAVGPTSNIDLTWGGPLAMAMRRHTLEVSRRLGFTTSSEVTSEDSATPPTALARPGRSRRRG